MGQKEFQCLVVGGLGAAGTGIILASRPAQHAVAIAAGLLETYQGGDVVILGRERFLFGSEIFQCLFGVTAQPR
jgi:hypothetical protein